jgi:hypothetical protein
VGLREAVDELEVPSVVRTDVGADTFSVEREATVEPSELHVLTAVGETNDVLVNLDEVSEVEVPSTDAGCPFELLMGDGISVVVLAIRVEGVVESEELLVLTVPAVKVDETSGVKTVDVGNSEEGTPFDEIDARPALVDAEVVEERPETSDGVLKLDIVVLVKVPSLLGGKGLFQSDQSVG